MKKRSGKRGFTLIELCIVIGLIGIVSAVGIASYGPLQQDAADHTAERQLCNIRDAFLQAKSMAESGGQIDSVSYTLNVGEESTDALSLYVKERLSEQLPELEGSYTVEAQSTDGTFTYTIQYQANGKVYQMTENGTSAIVQAGSLGEPETMTQIYDIMSTAVRVTRVDSHAARVSSVSHATAVIRALQAEGFDLPSMNAVSWHFRKDQDTFYWSTLDIATLELGSPIPVICFNVKKKTYTAYTTSVTEGTSEIIGAGIKFPKFNDRYSTYPAGSSLGDGEKTYENAFAYYVQAMREYGYIT